MKITVFVFVVVLIVGITPIAFGQIEGDLKDNGSLSVSSVYLEKSSYTNNESIVFVGTTDRTTQNIISVMIRSPGGSYVTTLEDPLSETNRTFETLPKKVGDIFSSSGIYTATAFSVQQDMDRRQTILLYYDGYLVSDTPIPPADFKDKIAPKILKPRDITIPAQNNDGTIVTFDVLAIDETDELVNVTCTPNSGNMFLVGETLVSCRANDSAGNSATPISFIVTVTPKVVIPEWIKNVAIFWCDGKIDATSFVEGIQYLINNDIIIINTQSIDETTEIPLWLKHNACWWSVGFISDADFVSGIEYLVKNGIIQV